MMIFVVMVVPREMILSNCWKFIWSMIDDGVIIDSCLQDKGQSNLSDLHSSATRVRGSLHRLIGAGCTDSYK